MAKLSVCVRQSPKTVKEKLSLTDPRLKELSQHDRSVARAAMQALGNGLRLELEYNGYPRLVEVHAVGLSSKGTPCMRVYQVEGDSESLEKEGWKLMSLGKAFDLKVVDIQSLAPRPGYQKGDLGMNAIFTEV